MGEDMGQDDPVDKNTLALSCLKLHLSLLQLRNDLRCQRLQPLFVAVPGKPYDRIKDG